MKRSHFAAITILDNIVLEKVVHDHRVMIARVLFQFDQ